MESHSSTQAIHWKQILALAGLDLAVLISWIAYFKYQFVLLDKFGFGDYGMPFTIVVGVILTLTPIGAGIVADRVRRKKGSRIPVINFGISFVAMVFMTVASLVYFEPTGPIRWLFPVMVVLWLISMNIFQSPAISTIELFVVPEKLPQVAAVFAVTAALTRSLQPSILDLIDLVGGPLTFALGGTLVFVTGMLFMRSTKKLVAKQPELNQVKEDDTPKTAFLLILGLGMGFGFLTGFFFEIFPEWVEGQLPFISTGEGGFKGVYFVSMLLGIAAILSYPFGKWVQKLGVEKTAIIAWPICAALIWLAWVLKGWVALPVYLLYPIVFALVSVTFLPIAFTRLGDKHKILGIGMYFSGMSLVISVIKFIQLFG